MMHLVAWPFRVSFFLLWYAAQLARANSAVLFDSLTRRSHADPRILAYECRSASSLELALLSIAVSLTPGSLVVAVRQRGTATLYVHCMYGSRDRNLDEISSLENHLLAALRPTGGRS